MVEKVCYTIKGDSLKIRREDDNIINFLSERASRCPEVAIEYNL